MADFPARIFCKSSPADKTQVISSSRTGILERQYCSRRRRSFCEIETLKHCSTPDTAWQKLQLCRLSLVKKLPYTWQMDLRNDNKDEDVDLLKIIVKDKIIDFYDDMEASSSDDGSERDDGSDSTTSSESDDEQGPGGPVSRGNGGSGGTSGGNYGRMGGGS
ncbi:hypothetical protein IFR05_015552 [Cadophora sp. M221]|nr:hypothetical protein IFR05_015552 [Cadophora sp. M221]